MTSTLPAPKAAAFNPFSFKIRKILPLPLPPLAAFFPGYFRKGEKFPRLPSRRESWSLQELGPRFRRPCAQGPGSLWSEEGGDTCGLPGTPTSLRSPPRAGENQLASVCVMIGADDRWTNGGQLAHAYGQVLGRRGCEISQVTPDLSKRKTGLSRSPGSAEA